MKTGQRGTYIWLMLLGLAVGAIVLTGAIGGAVDAGVAFGILAAYLAIVAVALAGTKLRTLQLPKAPHISTTRVSLVARRAAQRARSRADYSSTTGADNILTDVGLILNQRRRDGRWDRQLAMAVSLDDDALQPFIALEVPPHSADRLALVKFEITDQSGRVQFSRQMEQWLRDGANNIICDRQMPLRGSSAGGRSGVWDLRVSIDGALVGLHGFSVAPSTDERRQRLSSDGEVVPDKIESNNEDLPMSLQDMLREQQRSSDKG